MITITRNPRTHRTIAECHDCKAQLVTPLSAVARRWAKDHEHTCPGPHRSKTI